MTHKERSYLFAYQKRKIHWILYENLRMEQVPSTKWKDIVQEGGRHTNMEEKCETRA